MASPLLISANLRNMSAMNLETYKNKEVIAVSQDSLGQQGIRVAGGKLLGSSGGRGGTAAHTSTCTTGATSQQWELGMGEYDEFVMSASQHGVALNSDDCHTDLIWYNTGGRIHANSTSTCCGSKGANNLRFKVADGSITMEPCGSLKSMCVTLGGGNVLSLAKCNPASAVQKWSFDATTKTIRQGSQCFDSSPPADPAPTPESFPAGANVWARNLTGGAKAVVFINTGAAAVRVPCDKGCFATMSLPASVTHLKMRDLWAHSDNGTVAIANGLSVNVAPSAVVMLKLTPA